MQPKQRQAFDFICERAGIQGIRFEARVPRDSTDGGSITVWVPVEGMRFGREVIGVPADGRALHLAGFESNESISWAKGAIKGARKAAGGVA